jgi:hypothetical protein
MSPPVPPDTRFARPSASSDSTGSVTLHDAHVQTGDRSSIRRWFNSMRIAVFPKGVQKQLDTSGGKDSQTLQTFPCPVSSNECVADIEPGITVEPATVSRHVARDQQTSSVPASTPAFAFASVSVPTKLGWCMSAYEQAMAAPTPSSESTDPKDHEMTLAEPAKGKRNRRPRQPAMITPAVLDKIAKDNKKHQGATAAREIEVRNSSMGVSSSTSRARGVQASPMRWSQD